MDTARNKFLVRTAKGAVLVVSPAVKSKEGCDLVDTMEEAERIMERTWEDVQVVWAVIRECTPCRALDIPCFKTQSTAITWIEHRFGPEYEVEYDYT